MNREHLEFDPEYQVIKSIETLTRKRVRLGDIANKLEKQKGEITLLTGGPPCQGYSARGIRTTFSEIEKIGTPSNHLYKDMAKAIKAFGPKAFIFENVSGLMTARWTRNGEKGEIFQDVLKTFRGIKFERRGKILTYDIEYALLRAKDYGVPQNRPRLFVVGIRSDVYVDRSQSDTAGGFLPDPSGEPCPDPIDLLGDLVDPNWNLNRSTSHYPSKATSEIQRILRLDPKTNRVRKKSTLVTEHEYSKHSDQVIKRFELMIKGKTLPPELQIKKFAQRVIPARWDTSGPNITATSAPDDYVHFSQPRILTVREWARLQLIPDWYEFAGPRTTGGRRRAGDPYENNWDRELPKYTQIGNAVPVGLASRIGDHLIKIMAL